MSRLSRTLIPLLSIVLTCMQSSYALDKSAIDDLQIKNLKNPEALVFSGGQPKQDDFHALAQAGIRYVINLRSVQEQDWDEEKLVSSLGMEYHNIPVSGASGVNVKNAARLSVLLEKFQGEPVLVHCASGNRIGALIALSEKAINSVEDEKAIDKGKQWGLTRLESVVREQLSEM